MNAGPRHRAREVALQALYFWEVGKSDAAVALGSVLAEHWPDAAAEERALAHAIVYGVVAERDALDARIAKHSDHWRIERMAVIDRLVLRMAAWELGHQPDTPPAVVIDEAIELARTFGGDDSARFVNGVLDAVRKGLGEAGPAGD